MHQSKIKAFTQTVKDTDDIELAKMTSEDLIMYCARVSNPVNQNSGEVRLIEYLIDNAHWSPLEMVSITVEVETTRTIGRQLLRHGSIKFQEFSGRYADTSQLGMHHSKARLQDTKNRQNSLDTASQEIIDWWYEVQREVEELTTKRYKEALSRGIAKELSRDILPEGLQVSKMYANATLRSWIHYIMVRHANGTQLEHTQIANSLLKELEVIYPNVIAAIQKHLNH